MLVVQHNCGQGYESTVMVVETALYVGAGIVMIQELFIGNWEICHSGFNVYWLPDKRKEIRVMTAVRKDLGYKIMIYYKTNLIHHLYFMLLEICKLHPQSKKSRRKTRVVNVYNNRVGRGCTWDGNIRHTRKALEDID